MEQGVRRKRRKHSLKQKEVPAFYFNSHLTLFDLQSRLQRPRSHLHLCKSELSSPETRKAKVTFSPSPSESLLIPSDRTRDEFSLSPVKVSPSLQSLKPILKKTDSGLRMMLTSSSSQSPTKRGSSPVKNPATSTRFTYLEQLVTNLVPSRLTGIRSVLAKCRVKTREFYKEMHRQAALSEEEIQRERDHEEYVRRVIRDRSGRKKAGVERKSLQK